MEAVEEQLFGLAFNLWLENEHRAVLHGGSVQVDNGAVVFLGERGRGKSTTTLSCVAAGARLLTDDQVVIQRTTVGTFVAPALPWVNAWPDALQALGLSQADLPAVRSGSVKRRVLIPPDLRASAPVPLRTVFLLTRHKGLEAPKIIPAPRAGALARLAASSPTPRALDAMGQMGYRLVRIAEMMKNVEVLELAVPDDVRMIPDVGRLVVDFTARARIWG